MLASAESTVKDLSYVCRHISTVRALDASNEARTTTNKKRYERWLTEYAEDIKGGQIPKGMKGRNAYFGIPHLASCDSSLAIIEDDKFLH